MSLLPSLFPRIPKCDTYNSLRLRTTSDQQSIAPGTALEPDVHIEVDFRWLILPIASVILSLVLLLTVMFETARSGVPAWKMSNIAALLSIDHGAGKAIASQDHTRRLDERASNLAVKLKRGDDRGWFLEVND